VLRPYREALAEGGSVDDFLKYAGFAVPKGLLQTPSMNISRKPAVVSLLRLANAQLPQPQAKELADMIGMLTDKMTLSGTSEVEFLGPASRAKLVERFRPIHDWLSQVSGRETFFSDIEEMAICKPISESEALQSLLEQLSPLKIAQIAAPEVRDFLTRLRTHGPAL